ncbi:MAG: UPF0158 family protein [Bacteroidia bacterium]|nr:UPF0158 family protein [Bacteroidia bacterium]
MLDEARINEIADQINCGFMCYIHRKTHDIIFIPAWDDYSSFEPDAWVKDRRKVDKDFDQYYLIEPPQSFESFKIMERFAESVDNIDLKNSLIQALSKRKPFSHFKEVIDFSGDYRKRWFKFKYDSLVEMIKDQLNALTSSPITNDE